MNLQSPQYFIAAIIGSGIVLYLTYKSLSKLKNIKYSTLFLIAKLKESSSRQLSKFKPPIRIIIELIIISLFAFLLGKPDSSLTGKKTAVIIDNYFATAAYYGEERWIDQGKRLLKRYVGEDLYISSPKLNPVSHPSIDNIEFAYQDSNLISSLNELKEKGYSKITVIGPDDVTGEDYIFQDLKPDQKNLTRNLAISQVDQIDNIYNVTIRSFSNQDTKFTLVASPVNKQVTDKQIQDVVTANSSTVIQFKSETSIQDIKIEVDRTLDIIPEDSAYNLEDLNPRIVYLTSGMNPTGLASIKTFKFESLTNKDKIPNDSIVITDKRGNYSNQLIINPSDIKVSGVPAITQNSLIAKHLEHYSIKMENVPVVPSFVSLHSDLEVDNMIVVGHINEPQKIVYSGLELLPFKGEKNLFNSIIFLNTLNFLSEGKKSFPKNYFYSEASSNLQQDKVVTPPELKEKVNLEFDWRFLIHILIVLLVFDYIVVAFIFRQKNV